MNVGVPREIKDGERRVGMTPEGVVQLVADRHRVCVASGAGNGVGMTDDDYRSAGATIGTDADIFACTLVVKVKELQPAEFPLLVPGTTVFGFAQINRDPALPPCAAATGSHER